MPLFEYRCGTCDGEFELLVRQGDAPECPECHTSSLEKLFSATAHPSMGGAPGSLPTLGCPPADAPPCHPNCCRIPH